MKVKIISNPICVLLTSIVLIMPAFGEDQSTTVSSQVVADPDAVCRIPFEALKDTKTQEYFPHSTVLNSNDKLPDNLRQRYIVADLNSADKDGFCRGVQEHFSPVRELTEFPRLRGIANARGVDIFSLLSEKPENLLSWDPPPEILADLQRELDDLQNYAQQVDRFKKDPISKPPVFNGYCVGQTLNFCEIVHGQPKLVYRFVTSSSRSAPPPSWYYAPINIIQSRNWSSDRKYTPSDSRRDAHMGGGKGGIVPFGNGGHPIEMPNFLHFVPDVGYSGERANGIHEIAGGRDSGGTFGAPVSLGCIRLNKFQAKLARWWTPTNAKFFIYFEPNRYRTFGIAATGKAKGFKAPPDPNANIATISDGSTNTQVVTSKKTKVQRKDQNDLTFKIFSQNFFPL